MDALRNPYSPGAGKSPPELAGRDDIRGAVRVAVARAKLCRPEKSVMFIGLRGVGKTVMLVDAEKHAQEDGVKTVFVEAPENRPLLSVLAPSLRDALLSMSESEKRRDAMKRFVNFAAMFKLSVGGVGVEMKPQAGLASGDLEYDLPALMVAVGEAAQAEQTALVLLLDEVQYVGKTELSALCAALHRVSQRDLPLLFVGAGLPQSRGQLGKAKSYAERLFNFYTLGELSAQAAKDAVAKPALAESVKIEESVLLDVVSRTRGYPYFLQEWGKHVWNAADSSPITIDDVRRAEPSAVGALDADFFRVRFERLTPEEKRYLRAMAELELSGGELRSGDIAEILNKKVTALAPVRARLINKGMAYSAAYGDIAFTVPLFTEFLKRAMPGDDWRDS